MFFEKDAVITELNITRGDKHLDILLQSGESFKNSTQIEEDFPNWKDLYASQWAFVHVYQIYGFSAEDVNIKK